MEVTNEEPEQSTGLTQGDLAIAAYALAETFNSYLERYDEEDFGELSKEQMESSMDSLRTAFTKFDAILKAMQPQEEEQ
tara:strand:+ start:472 stop:708 length:237 start_codon:yes stop_codon:yes gene_type:complete